MFGKSKPSKDGPKQNACYGFTYDGGLSNLFKNPSEELRQNDNNDDLQQQTR